MIIDDAIVNITASSEDEPEDKNKQTLKVKKVKKKPSFEIKPVPA